MEEHINYKPIKILLSRIKDNEKTHAWRLKAQRYLKNFEYQYRYEGSLMWQINLMKFNDLISTGQKLVYNS